MIKMHLFKTCRLLLAPVFLLMVVRSGPAQAGPTLWDTREPLAVGQEPAREGWRAVPRDLFQLEKDPLKSSSDPGYYGREYRFSGDMVVENQSLTAVFSKAAGKVLLYGKASASPLGTPIAEIAPDADKPSSIELYNLLRNDGDEVVAEVFFSSEGAKTRTVVFSFGKDETIEVRPEEGRQSIGIRAPISYAVVPSFVGDDLIFGPSEETELSKLLIPAENMLLALLVGEEKQITITWPGRAETTFELGDEKGGTRPISALHFVTTNGQPLFISPQSAPGIWHREKLNSSYLEKRVASTWHPPFPARWVTQLSEAGVKARFGFHQAAGTVWRGVPGSYNYPVWFEGDQAFFHLGKKVPPSGEALIYFLEGQDTPLSIRTPVEILKDTLGRADAEKILDVPGRKLRTHHRRGAEGVRRACTCGCTEAIQAIFEAGEETSRREQIDQEVDDMIYFIKQHVERIDDYMRFADQMVDLLNSKAAAAHSLKPYVDEIRPIAEQISQEYAVQKENMRSLDYAGELRRRTLALTEKTDPKNLDSYMELLKAWRGMGGAQDYVVAQCHTLTRKLFQEASYASIRQPEAVPLALEIRSRCREILRHPDGYEIWPNY